MSVKLVAGVNFRNKKQRAKGAMGVCFQNNVAGAMGTFLGLWDPQVARMPHEDIVPVPSERHSIRRTKGREILTLALHQPAWKFVLDATHPSTDWLCRFPVTAKRTFKVFLFPEQHYHCFVPVTGLLLIHYVTYVSSHNYISKLK